MNITKNAFVCILVASLFVALFILTPMAGAYLEEYRKDVQIQTLGSSFIPPPEIVFGSQPAILIENDTLVNYSLSFYNDSAVIVVYYYGNNTQTIIVPINHTIIEDGGRYTITFVVNNTRSLGEFTVTVEGRAVYGTPTPTETPTYAPTETPTANVSENGTLDILESIGENTHTGFYNVVLALVISAAIAGIVLIEMKRLLK